jgi:hypothetical protein
VAADTEFQLIFRNATIVDGSGGPVGGRCGGPRRQDRAGGWPRPGRADEEVDARDLVLAPGFIDPHTHLDANLFWDADLTPSSSFGVTTVVTTNCGYALAPVLSEEARQYLVAAMSTVEQIPEVSFETGVPFDWSDLASYAARLDELDVLINHAFLIGHVPLRAAVLGVPGATPGERAPPRSWPWAASCARAPNWARSGSPPIRWSATPARAGRRCPGRSAGRRSCSAWPPCSARGRARVSSPWPTPRSSWAGRSRWPTSRGTSDWRRPRVARGRRADLRLDRGSRRGVRHHGPGPLGATGRGTVVPQISTRPSSCGPGWTAPARWCGRCPR